jgi:hypothetical protein
MVIRRYQPHLFGQVFGKIGGPFQGFSARRTSMDYKLTIHEKPSYLHAVVTGHNTKENIAGYIRDTIRECVARKYRKVLIEERLEGQRLRTMDVFGLVEQASRQYLGVLDSIAYVDVNAVDDLMRFAENVAVNRALPVRVFGTVTDAEKWLGEEESGPPAQPGSGDA